jgi:sec-independent protein translocase protein TatB
MGTPPPICLDTISMPDTLILMVLALVVFGPRRLPKIGRQIGKLMYEFRKASNDFKFQMEEELRQAEEADRRQKEEEERKRALAPAPPPPQLEQTTSQPAKAEPSPAEPESSAAVESPYPAQSTYPDPAAEGTRPEETAQHFTQDAGSPTTPELAAPPAKDTAPQVTSRIEPRIAPPSTGEKVAAQRPGAQPQQQDLFAGDAGKTPESVTPEAERSEPAAHHG